MQARQWTPQDTEILLGWVDEDPDMPTDLGMPEGSTKNSVFDMVNRLLLEDNSLLLAVDSEDGLLGFMAAANVQRDGSCIGIVGVSPHHRGKGGLVMRSAINVAFQQVGIERIISTVNKGRDRFAELHKSLGFKPPEVDVYVLSKEDWSEE